jgi:hypothetical protein
MAANTHLWPIRSAAKEEKIEVTYKLGIDLIDNLAANGCYLISHALERSINPVSVLTVHRPREVSLGSLVRHLRSYC